MPPNSFQVTGPVRLASVCLDPKSARELAEFAASTPVVRLHGELAEYLTEDRDLPPQWSGNSPFDICLIDFDRDRARARITAERVHASLPEVAVFSVSSESQPDLIIQAMRNGCSEYLLKPLTNDQLLQSIARVAARKKENQTAGQIVAFIGAKGGTGVTMLATHLGAILAKSHSRRALLLDLHPAMGDAELYLGLMKYQYSFSDLAESSGRLDRELLQSFVLHHRSGLDLLPAALAPDPARRTEPAAIGATLDFLRYCYQVLLIDCPVGLGPETLEAVHRADQLCIVTVPEVPALRNVVRSIDYLTRKDFPRDKIGVVINRWTKRSAISDEQIEQAIRMRIFWKLPNQYFEVIRIINDGDPSSRSSASELGRSIAGLAAQLASRTGSKSEAERGGKGLLALLGG